MVKNSDQIQKTVLIISIVFNPFINFKPFLPLCKSYSREKENVECVM